MIYAKIMAGALKMGSGAKKVGKGLSAANKTFARTKTGKRIIKNRATIAGLGTALAYETGNQSQKNKNKRTYG